MVAVFVVVRVAASVEMFMDLRGGARGGDTLDPPNPRQPITDEPQQALGMEFATTPCFMLADTRLHSWVLPTQKHPMFQTPCTSPEPLTINWMINGGQHSQEHNTRFFGVQDK